MGWQGRHPALAVRCPTCGKPKDERCINPASKRERDAPHLARIAATETTEET
jgi:hypothetical protein